jgi:hypothetical protein
VNPHPPVDHEAYGLPRWWPFAKLRDIEYQIRNGPGDAIVVRAKQKSQSLQAPREKEKAIRRFSADFSLEKPSPRRNCLEESSRRGRDTRIDDDEEGMIHNGEAIPTGVEQGGELSPEKGERSLASERREGTKNG